MELIKQIKEAEAEAKKIVEQAKADAVEMGEQAKAKRAEMLAAAEEQRKKAIAVSVEKAEAQGNGELAVLMATWQQEKEGLEASARGKMDECVAKVMEWFKG